MKNISSAFTTTLRSTNPGDLVFIDVRKTRVPAVVLGKDARGIIVGVLQGVDGYSSAPFHVALKENTSCISYGEGWLFDYDATNPEFRAGNRSWTGFSGVVHLMNNDLILSISPMSDDRSAAIDFNLTKKHIGGGLVDEIAPILAWSAWESSEHRNMENRHPIAQVIARFPEE
ncbi:hypothetical protein G6M50_36835 [Agrobacterium rhizogenes]|nr:hypothetical protein [Rhizobium rhizogenes]NTJ83354.1 hypothetical protein [Rhizobium rhizogenes]